MIAHRKMYQKIKQINNCIFIYRMMKMCKNPKLKNTENKIIQKKIFHGMFGVCETRYLGCYDAVKYFFFFGVFMKVYFVEEIE